jgi:GTPase SAR1 family protein
MVQGILVYDVSSRESFEHLDDWLSEAASYGAQNIPFIVCANKVDKKRYVTTEEGEAYANSKGFRYFETSASSGENTTEVFEALFDAVVARVAVV